MLDHLSKALDTVLYNEAPLPTYQQYHNQQPKEQIDTELCEKADPFKSIKNRIGINRTGNQKDDNSDSGPADANAK